MAGLNIPTSGWTSGLIAALNSWARNIENNQTQQNSQINKVVQSLTPPSTSPPNAVAGLAAQALKASVHLTWNASNMPLVGYQIKRSTTNVIQNAALIASAPAITGVPGTYLDPTAVSGATYYYWVAAVASGPPGGANLISGVGQSVSATPS